MNIYENWMIYWMFKQRSEHEYEVQVVGWLKDAIKIKKSLN